MNNVQSRSTCTDELLDQVYSWNISINNEEPLLDIRKPKPADKEEILARAPNRLSVWDERYMPRPMESWSWFAFEELFYADTLECQS